MANPTKYTQAYDFSDFAADNPSTPLPGTSLDVELAAIQTSIGEAVDAIADVRRSDGALANGIVTADSLAADLSIGFTLQGAWAVDEVYVVGDGVPYDGNFYRCLVANTATLLNRPDLDTTTWSFLLALSALSITDESVTPAKLETSQGAAFHARLETGATLGALIAALTGKTTPVDADTFAIADSAAASATKKLTWANLVATVFSGWGALVAAATEKATPVAADTIAITDSAASSATKNITWANLVANVFTGWGAQINSATGKTTPVDADALELMDSEASNATKKLTIANLKVLLGTTGVYEDFIPAGAFTPQITNGPAAGITEMATNLQPLDTLDFDTTTQEFAVFPWAPPKRWALGTITFQAYWTAASGAGGVAWALQGVAVSNDDALAAAYGTEQVVTDTFILANDLHITSASSAITIAGTPADADMVWLRIKRVPANASDTLAVDAKLIGVKIFYTVDQGNDA